jgi:hypothetical protein
MRKFLIGCGIVLVCLVGAGAVGFFMLARSGTALDAESAAYVQNSVEAVAGHWDADELWKRSTTHFRQSTKEDDLRAFFSAANSSLGRLLEYRGAQGQAMMSFSNAGRSATARYDAKVSFEKGDADIVVALVKDGTVWRIEGFHIGSDALMRGLVGLRS